jgi:hypothetical protein
MTGGPSILTVLFGYQGNSCEVLLSVTEIVTQTLLHERLFGYFGVSDEDNQKNIGIMAKIKSAENLVHVTISVGDSRGLLALHIVAALVLEVLGVDRYKDFWWVVVGTGVCSQQRWARKTKVPCWGRRRVTQRRLRRGACSSLPDHHVLPRCCASCANAAPRRPSRTSQLRLSWPISTRHLLTL